MEQPQYEIDPFEPVNVRENIKKPADNEIPLTTKPSQAVQLPTDGLRKFICHFCTSIVVDPILDSNCGFCFCRVCVVSNLAKGDPCPNPDCGEIFERKEISTFQKREMERITIACDNEDCKHEYPHNQTLDHRRQCLVNGAFLNLNLIRTFRLLQLWLPSNLLQKNFLLLFLQFLYFLVHKVLPVLLALVDLTTRRAH